MNIEEKTKMAHEYLLRFSGTTVADAWQYADAMEAEAEKRIKAKARKDAEESKVFFEKLTKNEDGSCKHFHITLNRGECFDCGEKLNMADSPQLEFQVDWSVSPDWASYWSYSKMLGKAIWLSHDVVLPCDGSKLPHDFLWQQAPSFNYQGDWKDSLRKRP